MIPRAGLRSGMPNGFRTERSNGSRSNFCKGTTGWSDTKTRMLLRLERLVRLQQNCCSLHIKHTANSGLS
jgi:hypothetical protein